MTYFGFLLRFLLLPVTLLLAFTQWDHRKKRFIPGFDIRKIPIVIAIHILLALAYTTPWDNYLVATGVWSYNPELVTGFLIGYVPIEEYTFFILETVLTGLWWWFLARHLVLPREEDFKPSVNTRLFAFSFLFIFWVLFTVLFFFGPIRWTYFGITLFWALPPIFPQLLFGADILWHYRKLVSWAIIPMGVYLSLIDMIALHATTWEISPTQTTGVLLFDILPLEEVVFFFITNVLISFGMTLMLAYLGWQRFYSWKSRNYKGLP